MKVQDRTISLNAAKIGLTNSEKTKDIKVSDMRSVFKVLDELPPVTTQPCEDVISREKVLLMIDSFKDNYGSFNFGSLIDLAREVRKMPPVNPQPKTGHWEIANSFCTCNKCGYETRPWNNTPFCPNCGFRMVESQESEDKND